MKREKKVSEKNRWKRSKERNVKQAAENPIWMPTQVFHGTEFWHCR